MSAYYDNPAWKEFNDELYRTGVLSNEWRQKLWSLVNTALRFSYEEGIKQGKKDKKNARARELRAQKKK